MPDDAEVKMLELEVRIELLENAFKELLPIDIDKYIAAMEASRP